MSPGVALAYFLWTRHRRGLIRLSGCWLALAILCRFLPAAILERYLVGGLVGFGWYTFMFLAMMFSFTPQRLALRESCFPPRLWSLPLRTWTLTVWPMLWATTTLTLFWLAAALGIMWPCGFKAPLVWPSLFLAVASAWWQALAWSPFPLPLLRVVVILAFFLVAEVAVIAIPLFGVPEGACCGVLIVLLAAAYAVAVAGVARARRGDVPKWGWPRWLRPIADLPLIRRQPLLSSPMQAQCWFEWRRCGRWFPIGLGILMPVWLPFLPWIAFGIEADPQTRLFRILPLLLREVGSLWLVVGSLLWLPPLIATAIGSIMGPLPGGRDRMSVLSSFLATRPISSWDLISAKLQTAARSTLAGWALTAVGLLLWAVLSGRGVEMAVQWETMRQHHPAGRFWATLLLLIGGPLALTWTQMAGQLWVGMAGQLWVGLRREVWQRMFFVVGVGGIVVAILVGQRWAEIPDPWQTFADLLPWLAGGAIVLKSLAAIWSLSRLKRNALVPSRVLIGALAAWSVLAIGLLVVLRWLIPREVVPTSGLVFGIVLLLPLTRLALAPLALAWNRHR